MLISARFDGGEKETRARHLNRELRKIGIKTYMVEVGPGQRFGEDTIEGLCGMEVMVAVCFTNYGQKTSSKYSTYEELEYANNKDIPILPIKFCKEWPPKSIGDEGNRQNDFIFKPDLLYCDWSSKKWSALECAKEAKTNLKRIFEDNDSKKGENNYIYLYVT